MSTANSDLARIPYGRQTIDEDDIAAVVAVLRGDWLTQGPAIEAFERAIAERVEAEHAVAFANGTASLHGACAAAGIGPGDLAATSPLTFAASANCARYLGAAVTFVDIDDTLCMDTQLVPPGVDVLVPVHFAGYPMDLSSVTNRPKVIVEDAAHALGAWTTDGPVGNCAHSDMTSFSFHPVKPITTGEGGVVTTNNADLADAMRRFRTHGITPTHEEGKWSYDIPTVGYNYRLTDLHAALGLSQLRKLDAFIERRQAIAARYDDSLAGLPLTLPPKAPPGSGHGYHIYPIRVANRRSVFEQLHERGIAVQVHYKPVPMLGAYAGNTDPIPKAAAAYEGLISLPIFPTLDEDSQDRVVGALKEILGA